MRYPTVFAKFILLMFCIAGCGAKHERKFVWDESIAQLTDKSLSKWLRKAPFSNELKQKDEDKILFTNANEVFPFMARFHNGTEEIGSLNDGEENLIYKKEIVLYQDPEWGDLFVSAMLIYDEEEVYLDRHFTKTGNPLFGGIASSMQTYSASLYETGIFGQTPTYKTGIYWAQTADKRYLLGFYQKQQLVFEVAIPCQSSNEAQALAKLQEVNQQLGLQITEWQQAASNQLKQQNTYETFWKDPFIRLYPGRYMLGEVQLKIKDTPLQQSQAPTTGDYHFQYQSSRGVVEIFTTLEDTDELEVAFNKAHEALAVYTYRGNKIFYDEDQENQQVHGSAKAYFKDNRYLHIHYQYPKKDLEARQTIHGILEKVRLSKH
ncbi:hypothetical protein H8S90_15490 [Olivibacter sp. SDN3]|uniref:hypothetical protein n=1 Tax=Olivibacter sp. SDN3 TaxID=2764720 RepID=UPI0016518852|nr:hypothetical protein [Olivibacter sp. SDN3]QNL48200.1 hypothetical protein H8S90_15490 [Olivibacter sp. SDN3]